MLAFLASRCKRQVIALPRWRKASSRTSLAGVPAAPGVALFMRSAQSDISRLIAQEYGLR